jgi:hypothetical protein
MAHFTPQQLILQKDTPHTSYLFGAKLNAEIVAQGFSEEGLAQSMSELLQQRNATMATVATNDQGARASTRPVVQAVQVHADTYGKN